MTQEIKIQIIDDLVTEDEFHLKFENIYKNIIVPILFDQEINLNLIWIIDIYFGSLIFFYKLLYKFKSYGTFLKLENILIYLEILEKLIDIYKEKKLDIILYLIDILKIDLNEENKDVNKYKLELLCKISKNNKNILRAIIKEDKINILINFFINDYEEIRYIIYDYLIIIFRNTPYYNDNIFDLNEEEKVGDIYFNIKIDTKKITKEKIIPLFEEKPEIFRIIFIFRNIGSNYNKDLLKEILDILFEKYQENQEKISFLINIISSLILIDDQNNLDK